MTRPKPKSRIVRDPSAEDAEVVAPTSGHAAPGERPEAPPPPPLMPTVENAEKYEFTPGHGCTIPDVVEIALAYLLVLTNSPAHFEKGSLRRLGLPAQIHAKLSDDAAQWFSKVAVPGVAPSPSSPPTPPTGA